MSIKQTLQTFFEEKQLENRMFVIHHNGKMHIIESEFIQDLIVNHTSPHEQEQIWRIISQIDFRNGDVNHFLEHLAKGYVMVHYS